MVFRFFQYLIPTTFLLGLQYGLIAQQQSKGFTQITSQEQKAGKTVALIIGISDYQFVEPLQFADRDAHVFKKYLESNSGGQVSALNIKTLYNEEATHANVYSALDWLASNVEEGDRCYLYFSGHGDVESMFNMPKGYLLTHDSPRASYRAGAVRMTDVTDLISSLSEFGIEVIFIADACRSGNLVGGKQGASAVISHLEQPWGKVIKMLSCGQDELSIERKDLDGGRGLFSYHLIEGLSGQADGLNGDGTVNLYELESYVKSKVIEGAQPNNQFPQFFGDAKMKMSAYSETSLKEWAQTQTDSKSIDRQDESTGKLGESLEGVGERWESKISEFHVMVNRDDPTNSELENILEIYQDFSKAHSDHNYLSVMKRTIIADLIGESQSVINDYVNGTYQYMADFRSIFQPIHTKLKACASLIEATDPLHDEIQSKLLFTSVMAGKVVDDDALAELEKAVDLDPKASFIQLALAKHLDKMGQREKAIETFGVAISLSPKWFYPYNNLGLLYQNSGELAAAIANYRTASELEPTDPSAFNNLGSAYLEDGNPKMSVINFKKAVELAPESAKYHFRLGEAYSKAGDYTSSNLAYGAAVDLDPKDDLAWARIASNHSRLNDLENAVKAMEKAVVIAPNNPAHHYNMACYYSKDGNTDKALKALRSALESGWKNKGHLQVDSDLESLRKSAAFESLLTEFFPD